MAINLEGGDSGAQDEAGTAHYRVYRAEVAYNTFIDSAGILIGGIVQGTTGTLLREVGSPIGTQYLGNLAHARVDAVVGMQRPADEISELDPLLIPSGPTYVIAPTSPRLPTQDVYTRRAVTS